MEDKNCSEVTMLREGGLFLMNSFSFFKFLFKRMVILNKLVNLVRLFGTEGVMSTEAAHRPPCEKRT